jgi:hypothetical protein
VTCLILSATPANAQDPACAPPTCVTLRKFDVTVSDFQTSKQGAVRLVTATLRFRNSGTKPLVLGYLSNSGVATDDRGNRYPLYGPVRGIGEINSRDFDPKFMLEPGASSEARFEFAWQPGGGDIYGSIYDLDLAVREIDPVTNSQYKLGLEHTLRFRRLTSEVVAGTSAVPPAKESTPNPQKASPIPTEVDPCGATPRCFNAGPFTANVVNVTPSDGGRHHLLTLNIRFRNVTTEPLILAYSATTSGAIDNYGNRYYWGRKGTYDVSVKGMGVVQGRRADPQFVLQPGQARTATFGLVRYEAGKLAKGTEFTYDVAIEQLEIIGGQQVRSVRQYSLNFPSLTAGTAGAPRPADVVKSIKDLLKKKN